jgi:DNA polymerase-3 subunit epsilon
MAKSFVAFDFETANRNRGSVCQVGFQRVVDGIPDAHSGTLLKPPPGLDYFDNYNTKIHGITADDVKDSPTFGEISGFLSEFVGDLPLIAHNAAFDTGALRDSLTALGKPWPSLTYFCTLVLSRRVLDLTSYTLPDVADHFSISIDKHHDAREDASAAAKIALALMATTNTDDLFQLADSVGVRPGLIDGDLWQGCRSVGTTSANREPSALRMLATQGNLNPESDLAGQVIVFTGTLGSMSKSEAKAALSAVGGIPADSVTKKTNMLVFGVQDRSRLRPGSEHSVKFEAAGALRAKGHPIEIVDEVAFLKMLLSDS